VSPTSSGCSDRLGEPKASLNSITGGVAARVGRAEDVLSTGDEGAADAGCDGKGWAEDDFLLQGVFFLNLHLLNCDKTYRSCGSTW
jgi:hypothetical protein